MDPGIVTVRPFQLDDLDAAAAFCEAARAIDPQVEPFAQRLPIIATGPRALLDLWRVATAENGELQGIAFAAVREGALFDFYAAVHPSLRRQGLGRALSEPAASCGAVLRTRVRDDARAGRGFLLSLGFAEASAQLSLHWNGARREVPQMPALRIRKGAPADQKIVEQLSRDAWRDAPDTFASRSDEIAQLFTADDRLVLIAESDRKPLGYLAGVQLGRTLGIEEVAVLPGFRRMGVGRGLVAHALRAGQSAVLSVSEANQPARALYKSLGFVQTARRIVYELRP